MGFFSRIGKAIVTGVQRIFGRPPKETQPQELTPIQEPEVIKVEKPKRKGAGSEIEAEALRRAVEMVIEANQHPGDATYEQARQAALVYINKSQKLAEKGATQSGNRRGIAQQYLDKELSKPEGVQARKQRKLEIFNANFGFDLTAEQADTVGQLMQSTSFKKLMEMFKEKYDIIIGMVGDQIEAGVDPVRVEQALDLWQAVGIEPDFAAFADVTELSGEAFGQLREDLMLYNEESVTADELQRADDISGIMGRYITW